MNIIKDPIDELLKSDAASQRDQYIDDADFTMRVINNLPTASRISSAMRFAIPFAFTLLAATFVALFAGGGNFVVEAVMDIATNNMSRSAFAFVVIVGIMTAVSITAANDS